MSVRQNEKIVGRTCQWVPPSSLSMLRTTRDEGPPNRHLLLSLPPGHPSASRGAHERKKRVAKRRRVAGAATRGRRAGCGKGQAASALLFRPPAGRRPPRTAAPLLLRWCARCLLLATLSSATLSAGAVCAAAPLPPTRWPARAADPLPLAAARCSPCQSLRAAAPYPSSAPTAHRFTASEESERRGEPASPSCRPASPLSSRRSTRVSWAVIAAPPPRSCAPRAGDCCRRGEEA